MRKLAIVGFGPRGLHSLECLLLELANSNIKSEIAITIFERTKQLGCGQVWNTNQPDVNWTNISERALQNLAGRPKIEFESIKIPAFLSYQDWLPEEERNPADVAADNFPPRRKVGKYLNERANSLVFALKKHQKITIVHAVITELSYASEQFTLLDLEGENYTFDEVLLTIGHQPTKLSKELESFKIQALESKHATLLETYPIENIIRSDKITPKTNVAIRGLGLSMIDAVRALTIEKGARFKITNTKTKESVFLTSENVPKKIIPYSLNGLPMAAKPLNAYLDGFYTPTKKQMNYFKDRITNAISDKEKTNDATFLKQAIAEISSEVYLKLEDKLETDLDKENLITIIINWLDDVFYAHELIENSNQDTVTLLQSYLEMAVGNRKTSLDYCVGQVVRHCQPTLYKLLSHADFSKEVMQSIISLDEQLKRYSYGPPVESLQQLLALYRADILDVSFTNHPEITFEENKWKFSKNEKSSTVDVIINSVLSAPQLLEVSSPLVLNLLRNNVVKPIHSELGVHTNKDGTIIMENKTNMPLAILGRLAKGSVIGVDAILECFGPRIKDWAIGAVSRLK